MMLSKITEDYKKLQDEDLDPEQLTDMLECIEGAFEDKAKNIMAVINNFNTLEIDEEIKRLQQRKKYIVNKKDSLKEYLRYNMEATGINKIEHPLFSVTLSKPSQKVQVTNVDLIPDEFITVKTEIKPDLAKIKKELKNSSVPGAELIDGQGRLLIK